MTEPTTTYDLMLKHKNEAVKYARPFHKTFGVYLGRFHNIFTGFDIVAFDDWLKPYDEDEKSMKDIIIERYGEEAAKLIERLIG